ncbi:STE/STE11 protein kinase Mkh1 [Schizosaccharomyces octosporus yFS286]|uniref:mitogen-activated protein kinase kinase kinase n=1 Tax=Schizosaccharomyces octosporus (strain yFS286) TaxID=483514 RepID=S9Q2W5_SCHOY|nr:STE/STE11 protein kinase Mkh1 [Schizosaccharomyces octosporus yFS286]EPX74457.1 STE/STE11 protein kinase Mkh1 [Schizosaccharomyces octosporus yFS286]
MSSRASSASRVSDGRNSPALFADSLRVRSTLNADDYFWNEENVLEFLQDHNLLNIWKDALLAEKIEGQAFVSLVNHGNALALAQKYNIPDEEAAQLTNQVRQALFSSVDPSGLETSRKLNSPKSLDSPLSKGDDVSSVNDFNVTSFLNKIGYRNRKNSSTEWLTGSSDGFPGQDGLVATEELPRNSSSSSMDSLKQSEYFSTNDAQKKQTSLGDGKLFRSRSVNKRQSTDYKEKSNNFLRKFRVPGFSREKEKDKSREKLPFPTSPSAKVFSKLSLKNTPESSYTETWVPRVHRLESQIGLGVKKQAFVLATTDDENFIAVNVTNVNSAYQLRETLAKSVSIDSSPTESHIYLTEVGGAQYIESLDDIKLDITRRYVDEFGTIKFFITPAKDASFPEKVSNDTVSISSKSSNNVNVKYPSDEIRYFQNINLSSQSKRNIRHSVLTSDFDKESPVNAIPPGTHNDKKTGSAPNLAVLQESPSRRFRGFEKIRGAKGEMAARILDGTEEDTGKNRFKVLRPHKKITLKLPSSSSSKSSELSPKPSLLGRNFIAHRDPPSPPLTNDTAPKRTSTITRQSSLRYVHSPVSDSPEDSKSMGFNLSVNTGEFTDWENDLSFNNAPAFDESEIPSDTFWAVQPKNLQDNNPEMLKERNSLKTSPVTTDSQTNQRTVPEFSHGDDLAINLSPLSHHIRGMNINNNAPISLQDEEQTKWEVRPSADDLYRNVDQFFPRYNLDNVLVSDSSKAVSSPTKTSIRPKVKSVRYLAREVFEARKALLRNNRKNKGVNLLRRSSTKFWGSKIEEVKPEGNDASSSVISPSNDTSTFKWLKGELIGNGTYGRVFIAMNVNTGELIAVKQVEIPQTVNTYHERLWKNIVDSINSEIETMADLEHINVVQYLGFEKTDTDISIFLEYVSGGSVSRCLRNYGPFEESVVRFITKQVLQGLAYLHSKGIIHRDLKADNLLIDFDGMCKISDFGISKHSENVYGNDANLSMQGTIFWMAPEVIDSNHRGYSAKVDIWSLGCVVLEMLGGNRPWSTEEAIQAMFKLGTEKKAPPLPSELRKRVSEDSINFLNECFTIDADKRPTAEELLSHPFLKLDSAFTFESTELYKLLHERHHR